GTREALGPLLLREVLRCPPDSTGVEPAFHPDAPRKPWGNGRFAPGWNADKSTRLLAEALPQQVSAGDRPASLVPSAHVVLFSQRLGLLLDGERLQAQVGHADGHRVAFGPCAVEPGRGLVVLELEGDRHVRPVPLAQEERQSAGAFAVGGEKPELLATHRV